MPEKHQINPPLWQAAGAITLRVSGNQAGAPTPLCRLDEKRVIIKQDSKRDWHTTEPSWNNSSGILIFITRVSDGSISPDI